MRPLLLPLLLTLAGCATPTQPADPVKWSRVDCKRANEPAIQKHFEQSKAVCLVRADAAGVAGSAPMPVGSGLGGGIASGMERAAARNRITQAAVADCMAQAGYIVNKQSEFAARCSLP